MIDYLKSRNEYENVEVYRDSMNENADSIVRRISRKYYHSVRKQPFLSFIFKNA